MPMHIQCNGTEDCPPGATCPAKRMEEFSGYQGLMPNSNWERNEGQEKGMGEAQALAESPGTLRLGEDLAESFPDIKRTA